MFRYTVNSLTGVLSLIIAMVLVSCASQQKESNDNVGEMISEAPASLSFPSLGSDSKEIPGLQTINFDHDMAALSIEARKTLAANADWIQAQQNIILQVEGHCDNRGSTEYNLSLGERRAKVVRDYLVSLGVDPNRLSTISYGKEKPLDASFSEMAYNKNRRANFIPMSQ